MFTVPVPESKLNQRTRERIKEGIYLLAYFIHKANWETGRLLTTFGKIEEDTGFPERTARRWLEMLVEAGEITVQRVRQGTLVTIVDYEDVARTRKVAWKKGSVRRTDEPAPKVAERNRPHVAASESDNRPDVAEQPANSGRINRPDVAEEPARSGRLNNNRNMYQNHVQNEVQNMPSISVALKGALAALRLVARKPEDLEPGDKDRLKRESAARLKIAGMDEEELEKLAQEAMENMESGPGPNMKMFLSRNGSGKLQPAGPMGAAMVARTMVKRLAGEEESHGAE